MKDVMHLAKTKAYKSLIKQMLEHMTDEEKEMPREAEETMADEALETPEDQAKEESDGSELHKEWKDFLSGQSSMPKKKSIMVGIKVSKPKMSMQKLGKK